MTSLQSCERQSRFFPKDVWNDTIGNWSKEKQADFYEGWFGDQLAAMKEKPLTLMSTADKQANYVRLLFLPSFTNGSMLRLSYKDDGRIAFVFKQLDGAGGYSPGHIRQTSDGEVDTKTSKEIVALIKMIDPWGNTPTQIRNPEMVCADGTQIVVEFAKGQNYKVISRHECELNAQDPIRQFTNKLNGLSRMEMIWPNTFDAL